MNDDTPTRRVEPDDHPTIRGLATGLNVFGRYTLEVMAGRGGMGVVWRARDEKLDRTVALKFLPPEVAADAEAVRDLKLETTRCLELTHPHIVRVYDFVERDSFAALAMEYVAGESLAQRKAAAPGRCLGVSELAPLVAQLCAALDYAHRDAHVAHRDLKPANLLVTADGKLKITDFGIARSLAETHTRLTGRMGGTSGTLLYMSPQQLTGGKTSSADDIYALGATLYELLTGKPPFFTGDITHQTLNLPPAPLAARRVELGGSGEAIPAAWEQTILACLAKDPAQRPQSAGEVLARLQGTEKARSKLSVTPAPMSGIGEEVKRPELKHRAAGGGRGWWLGFAAALAVLLALAAGGYYFIGYAPEQARRAVEAKQAAAAQAQSQARVAQEEKAFQGIVDQVAALTDGAPPAQRDATAAVVKTFLTSAPVRHRVEVENVWTQRLAGWESARQAAQKAASEQKDHAAIGEKIAALADGVPVAQREVTEAAVKSYIARAPESYRDDIENQWQQRLAAWDAYRVAHARGGVMIRTVPSGAEVRVGDLTPERSPVALRDVRLGQYPLVIKADGYEAYRGLVEVKENEIAEPGPIRLVRQTGDIEITSEPSGLRVLIMSADGEIIASGATPFKKAGIGIGALRIQATRPGYGEAEKKVTLEEGKSLSVDLPLTGAQISIESEPAGADVEIDGRKLGQTPLQLNDQPPGSYRVVISKPDFDAVTKTVTAKLAGMDAVKLTLKENLEAIARRKVVGVWIWPRTLIFKFDADGTFQTKAYFFGNKTGLHHGRYEKWDDQINGLIYEYENGGRTTYLFRGDNLVWYTPNSEAVLQKGTDADW